mmetsp:Transcript_95160/g.296241  ORF Transcript_95160/g.296241 Transcript_95160/m.296241 type:complete len:219 (-) Transcript_95160:639-1295(-)
MGGTIFDEQCLHISSTRGCSWRQAWPFDLSGIPYKASNSKGGAKVVRGSALSSQLVDYGELCHAPLLHGLPEPLVSSTALQRCQEQGLPSGSLPGCLRRPIRTAGCSPALPSAPMPVGSGHLLRARLGPPVPAACALRAGPTCGAAAGAPDEWGAVRGPPLSVPPEAGGISSAGQGGHPRWWFAALAALARSAPEPVGVNEERTRCSPKPRCTLAVWQ